jgi:hypothetical protein
MSYFQQVIKSSFKGNRYMDFCGVGTLVNGTCEIEIPEDILNLIKPDSEGNDWLIFLSPYGDIELCVAGIGDNYFTIKERTGGTSTGVRFGWNFSAVKEDMEEGVC